MSNITHLAFATSSAIEQATHVAPALDLTRHWAGLIALVVFFCAYLLVVLEDRLQLRKSKPVMLAAGLIWLMIGIAYMSAGDTTTAAAAVRGTVAEFGELMLFIVVAVTYVNTMEDRGVFNALRAWLTARGLSLRALFWLTGLLAFFLSSQIDNLTTALVMGTVVLTVGNGNARFVALGCVNVVVAANAGGAWSPFGDITTLMVWQEGHVGFWQFYALFLPALVNWAVPAFFMQFALPNSRPAPVLEDINIKRGGWAVVALFALTIATTVSAYNLVKLPPFIGMTTGLGLLQVYSYYLGRRRPRRYVAAFETLHLPDPHMPRERGLASAQLAATSEATLSVSTAGWAPASGPHYTNVTLQAQSSAPVRRRRYESFDVFAILQRAEWDTLMFFYGIILCVDGLALIGYLAGLSNLLYAGLGATAANIGIGLISAVVDNIPVMFAVLNMNPDMNLTQWLLVTLTAGVGGSLLSVGSAAGVALMGHARGVYTFGSHLRWTWAIALGYAASILVHRLING
jgi:Na+/H+ antiporter NhaD/arsenite permease-like protein